MTAENYRISDITKATHNGRRVKIFKAWQRDQPMRGYLYAGQFTAPVKTANRDLWKIAQEKGETP